MNRAFWVPFLIFVFVSSASARPNCLKLVSEIAIGVVKGGTYPIPWFLNGSINLLRSYPLRMASSNLVRRIGAIHGDDRVTKFVEDKIGKTYKGQRLSDGVLKELIKAFPVTDGSTDIDLSRLGLKEGKTVRNLTALIAYALFVFVGPTDAISDGDFDSETADFEETDEKDVIVIVDMFDDATGNFFVKNETDKRIEHLRKLKGKVFVVRSTDPDVVRAELKKIKEKNGLVTRLEISAHGRSGKLVTREEIIPINTLLDSRLLAPDAKVRFVSCSIAEGEEGRESLEKFADRNLSSGGSVSASQMTSLSTHNNWMFDLFPGVVQTRMGLKYLTSGHLTVRWAWESPKDFVTTVKRPTKEN